LNAQVGVDDYEIGVEPGFYMPKPTMQAKKSSRTATGHHGSLGQ
jgi:hypothetical protein